MNNVPALNYRNAAVIDRYADRFALSPGEAEEHWVELMKFLALAATDEGPFSPSSQVDEAWHEFLADESSYSEFCSTVLKETVLHIPSDGPERELYDLTVEAMWRRYGSINVSLWPSGTAASCKGQSCRSCKSCKLVKQ